MISRRRFFKIFSTLGLGIVLLPKLLFREGFSEISIPIKKFSGSSRNWLIGHPKRGCSCPLFPFSHLDQIEKDFF